MELKDFWLDGTGKEMMLLCPDIECALNEGSGWWHHNCHFSITLGELMEISLRHIDRWHREDR